MIATKMKPYILHDTKEGFYRELEQMLMKKELRAERTSLLVLLVK